MLGTEDFRLFFSKNLKLFFRRLWKKRFRYFEKKSRKSGDFGKKVLDFLRKKAENLRLGLGLGLGLGIGPSEAYRVAL